MPPLSALDAVNVRRRCIWTDFAVRWPAFPPSTAHGQSRLPALTLNISSRLSNSFFGSPGLRPRIPDNNLMHLGFPKQYAALHCTQVVGGRYMPQTGSLADCRDRISLAKPHLEGR